MEDAVNDAVDGASWVDALVVPASDELGNDPFQDLRGDFTCYFVEDLVTLACTLKIRQVETDIGEMIFGQHRMGRISGMIVVEYNQLLVLATLNDL
jgi:hypothetical protein